MASFASIKPLLDALPTEELISAGEYISQQLEKQLGSEPAIAPSNTSEAEKLAADSTIPESSPSVTNTIEEKEYEATDTFDQNKPSPLLQLPRELRDEIFSLAVGNASIHYGSKTYKQAQVPSILHTNRQLRHEASCLFFSQPIFVFWGDPRFSRMAKLLDISGNVWNRFVKCVVLIPHEPPFRDNPFDIYHPPWSAQVCRDTKAEAGLGDGVVLTAMRRAGFGRELRYEVVGELEEVTEVVIG